MKNKKTSKLYSSISNYAEDIFSRNSTSSQDPFMLRGHYPNHQTNET